MVHSLSAKVTRLHAGVDGLRREQDALREHLHARRERRVAAAGSHRDAVADLDLRARRLEAAWQRDLPRMQAMLGRTTAALTPHALVPAPSAA